MTDEISGVFEDDVWVGLDGGVSVHVHCAFDGLGELGHRR